MGTSERLDDPYLQGPGPLTPGGGGGSGGGGTGGGGPGDSGQGTLPPDVFPQPDGVALPVTIDGRSYLVDTSRQTNQQERFRRSSIQLLNSQQNVDKGESALTAPEVWRRTYRSWHHGMGQAFADREDADPFRFRWSKGVNPWEKWELSLLHETKQVVTDPMYQGVMCNGQAVYLHASRSELSASNGEQRTAAPLDVADDSVLASDGYHAYVIGALDRTLHIVTVTNAGTAIVLGDRPVMLPSGIPPTRKIVLLVFANYKLVACDDVGSVWDLTGYIGVNAASTAPPEVYSAPIVSGLFVSGCAGKQSMYLMERNGDKTTVHSLTLTRSSGTGAVDTLLYGGQAAELPDGEYGHCLFNYLGYIAIGTSKGFRFAVDSGTALTYGPLIETPQPVTAFEGQGKFLYYALSGFDGDSGIGRADLTAFVADLQPAYAPDLMAVGHPDARVAFINTMPDGKIMFGLTDGGMWKEQDTFVDEGRIIGSAWSFNVVDAKKGLYVNTQTSSDSGGTGSLWISYNKSNYELFLGNFAEPNQRFPLNNSEFYSATLRGRISPNADKTQTPKIYSLELRATYIRGRASEWQVPCILHDEVELDNGGVQGRDVIADFNHLLSLVETGRRFMYVEEGPGGVSLSWTVLATDFIWSPQERSQTAGWQGVFTIYFREVR